MSNLEDRGLERELQFQASRSGGGGGQKVNKGKTKGELGFQGGKSEMLTEGGKGVGEEKLGSRIKSEG